MSGTSVSDTLSDGGTGGREYQEGGGPASETKGVITSWGETLAARSKSSAPVPTMSFFFDEESSSTDIQKELSADPIYRRVNENKSNTSQSSSVHLNLSSESNFSSHTCNNNLNGYLLVGIAPEMVGRVTNLLSGTSLSSSLSTSVTSTAASFFSSGGSFSTGGDSSGSRSQSNMTRTPYSASQVASMSSRGAERTSRESEEGAGGGSDLEVMMSGD